MYPTASSICLFQRVQPREAQEESPLRMIVCRGEHVTMLRGVRGSVAACRQKAGLSRTELRGTRYSDQFDRSDKLVMSKEYRLQWQLDHLGDQFSRASGRFRFTYPA